MLWLICGGASALALVVVLRTVPAEPSIVPHSAPAGAEPAHPEKAGPAIPPGFPALVIAYGLFGFGYIITATFLVAIIRATPATAPLEPLVWLAVGIAGAPSVAFWVWVGRRTGLMRAYSVACVVEAVGIAASVLWTGPIGALSASLLIGGTFMAIPALGLMAARSLITGDPRRIMALMTAAFGVGQVIGPTFAGLLHDHLGGFLVPSLAAATALMIAAGLTCRPDPR